MSITPDGKNLFVRTYEREHWNGANVPTCDIARRNEPKSGAHNTICGLDGKEAYLAGLRSPDLTIADTKTLKATRKVGPFSNSIRPFTVNASQTLCFVNVNGLLGFEIGDIKSGKMLHRVEVKGFPGGKAKRHGCPSHGVGMT